MSHRISSIVEIQISGVDCLLHPEKVMFFPEGKMLLISDLHLGKGQHFRKNGLAIPLGLMESNFKRLEALCTLFDPLELLFLGDLFHSDPNASIDRFAAFRQKSSADFRLIMGNHDIYDRPMYEELGIECCTELEHRELLLVHDEQDVEETEMHVVSGHIHPAIRLREAATKKSLRLPVFVLGESRSYLPAFGAFTGMHVIKAQVQDRLYAIAEEQIIEISKD